MTEEALYSTWDVFHDLYYGKFRTSGSEAKDVYLFVCRVCERLMGESERPYTLEGVKLLVFKTLHGGNFNPRGYFSEFTICEALRDVFDSSDISNFRLNLAVYRAFKAYKDEKTIFQLLKENNHDD